MECHEQYATIGLLQFDKYIDFMGTIQISYTRKNLSPSILRQRLLTPAMKEFCFSNITHSQSPLTLHILGNPTIKLCGFNRSVK